MGQNQSSNAEREFHSSKIQLKRQSTAIDDVAFLTRSEHRVVALGALAERPRTRNELLDSTGVSSSTIGRTIREFENRYWIRRTGHHYEATQLGRFVATKVSKLIEQIRTERKLRDFWELFPFESSELPIERFSDANITVAEATDPYRPVNRFVSLLDETDQFQIIGAELSLFEPCREKVCQQIIDGLQTEVIEAPEVSRYVLTTYPDLSRKTLDSGNIRVLSHDDLPNYALSLFDDRVAISGCDPASGTVRVLIDTEVTAVREWAESTYESYRREAHPLDTLTAP